MLSPALCVVRPGCSGLAGRGLGEVLGGEPPLPCSPRLYALFGPSAPALPEGARVKSWLSAAGQRKAPLVAAWRRCHIRGDCEAGGMIQLVFYCRVRRLAVNPSVGVRRQLPLHKGGPVAGRPYCLCLGSLCLPGQRAYDSPGTGLAQRGSAVWVQRHAAR